MESLKIMEISDVEAKLLFYGIPRGENYFKVMRGEELCSSHASYRFIQQRLPVKL